MWCSQVYGAMLFNSLTNDQKGCGALKHNSLPNDQKGCGALRYTVQCFSTNYLMTRKDVVFSSIWCNAFQLIT